MRPGALNKPSTDAPVRLFTARLTSARWPRPIAIRANSPVIHRLRGPAEKLSVSARPIQRAVRPKP